MSKYFDTNSRTKNDPLLKEDVAIGISKKEKGEKPKDEGNAFGGELMVDRKRKR